MPVIRPFRALRYAPEIAGDIGRLIAPPYDVIDDAERRLLLARDPRNVVRLDLPTAEAGDRDPDERYRRASRLLGAWRSEGAVRRDARPAIYAYEQEFKMPGGSSTQVRRGFLARVGLEPFGRGIRAHERTLPAAREDRYRLLRATNVNTSPVVAMYEDGSHRAAATLDAVASSSPTVEAIDAVGDRHRLWVLTAGTDGRAEVLLDRAAAGPLTIADGHHRYETALRFQAEQRVGSADPAALEQEADFVLVLLLEPEAGPILVLPTHRVIRGLGDQGLADLLARLGELFEVEVGVSAERLIGTFRPGAPATAGGAGRFGLWTRSGGSILRARRDALEPLLPAGGPALRGLDVVVLEAALEALAGIDAAAIAGGERLTYTKDAAEALALVDSAAGGADAAIMLDATPAGEIIAVAAEGDVMPQKSTYIYPKAISGLVMNPLEG